MNQKYIFVLLLILVIVMGALLFKSIKKTTKSDPVNKSQTNQIVDNKQNDVQSVNTESGITLTIESPRDQETFNSPNIKVSGKTGPLSEVFINENETKADQNGNFTVDIVLVEGENIINVTANDSLGNFAEKEITVNLEATK